MTSTQLSDTALADLREIADLELIEKLAEREHFSKDAFEYSPVLIPQLKDCLADVVVRPLTVNAVEAVAGVCFRHQLPLTMRGSGTGNYGQSVPLKGGLVMLMGALNQMLHYDSSTGVVTVQPGCFLRDLDQQLAQKGRQLRLMPSTWRTATVGGFIAGGSGGIGSVRWGFLRDPGHLLGMHMVAIDSEHKEQYLSALEAQALNHAYGTNGIITALKLSTAPAVQWHEVCIDCQTWADAVSLLKDCVGSAVDLHLCSLLERPIVDQLPKWCGSSAGQHRLLFLVAPDGVSTLEELAQKAGATFTLVGVERLSLAGLRELTWNHTTLHMRAADPAWTYLQMLLPQPELPAMEALKQQWGDNLLWHLEAVRQRGGTRLAALPLVRWQGLEALERLMEHCRQLGALIFNPHVITVEDGGLGVVDGDQVAAKHRHDPLGLLNPGKLKGWSAR